MTHLAVPQPALSKRGSLTPSVRRLLNRYPPAILEDNTPPERIQEQEEIPQPTRTRELPLTSFDRRFPQGYKVADVSIPLHPDEVPPGSENIFSPEYNPICRKVLKTSFGLIVDLVDGRCSCGDFCVRCCGVLGERLWYGNELA